MIVSRLLLIYLACALLSSFATCVNGQVVFNNDFDQHQSARLYTVEDLNSDWNEPVWNNGVEDGRVSIVRGAEAYGGSGSSLAINYPAKERGSKKSGAQWRLKLKGEHEELYSSYRVKFKSGFDFVRGGKLPGLAGGTAPTGSDIANGKSGWTARMMWRTRFKGKPGEPRQSNAEVISYAQYANSGSEENGTSEDKEYWMRSRLSRVKLQSGTWYQVTQRIKLNDPGIPNGTIQIWLDGKQVLDQRDVLFRTVPELKIDIFYFSTFFGGGSSWASSKAETVYFDDFVISTVKPKLRHR